MRQSQTVAGGMVIQCACQRRDGEPIADSKEILDGADVRRVWLPQDACMCNGSGWVCWRCMGRKWVVLNGRAVPCESCAMVENGEVKPQPWLLRFQQAEREALAQPIIAEHFAATGAAAFADVA